MAGKEETGEERAVCLCPSMNTWLARTSVVAPWCKLVQREQEHLDALICNMQACSPHPSAAPCAQALAAAPADPDAVLDGLSDLFCSPACESKYCLKVGPAPAVPRYLQRNFKRLSAPRAPDLLARLPTLQPLFFLLA